MALQTETQNEIARLAQKESTVAEIVNKTGTSQGSIYKVFHRQGIPLPTEMKRNLLNRFYEYFLYSSSREREYFLGLTYAICDNGTACRNSKTIWEARQKKLIEITKEILKSRHTIYKDKGGEGGKYGRGSQCLSIRSKRLSQILIDFGVHSDKKLRTLPEISKTNPGIHPDNLSHLVRGLSDGGFRTEITKDLLTHTIIQFPSITLIRQLEDILVERTGVARKKERKGKSRKKNRLLYGHEDSIRIHDFIYQDWDWIEETGFYLPSKKEKFLVGRKLKKQKGIIDDEKLRILKSPELNFSDGDVSRMYDCSLGTVARTRKKYDIPSHHPHQQIKIDSGKINLLLEHGFSNLDAAKLFDCGVEAVKKFIF